MDTGSFARSKDRVAKEYSLDDKKEIILMLCTRIALIDVGKCVHVV